MRNVKCNENLHPKNNFLGVFTQDNMLSLRERKNNNVGLLRSSHDGNNKNKMKGMTDFLLPLSFAKSLLLCPTRHHSSCLLKNWQTSSSAQNKPHAYQQFFASS